MQINTVFLHVGFHKTATSSIQRTLYENRELLQKNGVLYAESLGINQSTTLYSLFCDNPGSYHVHIKQKRCADEIAKFNASTVKKFSSELMRTANCVSLVISGEDLEFLSKEGLFKFCAFLQKLIPNSDIKIVSCVRDIAGYYPSMMQERIKGGGLARDVKGIMDKNFYKRRLRNFITVFGMENITVYPFEEACLHPKGPVGAFFHKIGLAEVLDDLTIITDNEGISDKAIDLIGFINKKLPLLRDGTINKPRYHTDTVPIESIRGAKFRLSNDEIEILNDIALNDIRWLKQHFNITYNLIEPLPEDQEMIFSQDYYEDVIAIYSDLSDSIQLLVYEYLNEKFDHLVDETSKNVLKRLKDFIETNYPEVVQLRLEDTIKQASRHEMALTRLRAAFAKPAEKPIAEIYIDIALFLEQHDQIDGAAFCMRKALEYRPYGPFIKKKIDQYQKMKGLSYGLRD